MNFKLVISYAVAEKKCDGEKRCEGRKSATFSWFCCWFFPRFGLPLLLNCVSGRFRDRRRRYCIVIYTGRVGGWDKAVTFSRTCRSRAGVQLPDQTGPEGPQWRRMYEITHKYHGQLYGNPGFFFLFTIHFFPSLSVARSSPFFLSFVSYRTTAVAQAARIDNAVSNPALALLLRRYVSATSVILRNKTHLPNNGQFFSSHTRLTAEWGTTSSWARTDDINAIRLGYFNNITYKFNKSITISNNPFVYEIQILSCHNCTLQIICVLNLNKSFPNSVYICTLC